MNEPAATDQADIATAVGREIRDLRKVRGLTLAQVAYLSQVERGLHRHHLRHHPRGAAPLIVLHY